MALVACRECDNQISDMAKTCPNCGISVVPLPQVSGVDLSGVNFRREQALSGGSRNPASVSRPDRPGGMIRACWILLLATCAVSFIPGFGFAAWIFGIPVLLATFILSIIILTKGATTQGVLILLGTVIFAPAIIFLAPIITTLIVSLLSLGAGLATPQ